jgi:hypothetical protein
MMRGIEITAQFIMVCDSKGIGESTIMVCSTADYHNFHWEGCLLTMSVESVIWLGDFNYRIGLNNELARALVKKRDLEKLYENDQVRNYEVAVSMCVQCGLMSWL